VHLAIRRDIDWSSRAVTFYNGITLTTAEFPLGEEGQGD